MKPKYKVGSLVRTTDGTVGMIEGIHINKNGVEYELQDSKTFIETEIAAQYREVTPRKVKTTKLVKGKKSTTKAVDAAA